MPEPDHSQRFNLSDWTLHHRTLVGYFLLVIALIGDLAMGQAEPGRDPPVYFQVMVIRTFWPGASAHEEWNSQVTGQD